MLARMFASACEEVPFSVPYAWEMWASLKSLIESILEHLLINATQVRVVVGVIEAMMPG